MSRGWVTAALCGVSAFAFTAEAGAQPGISNSSDSAALRQPATVGATGAPATATAPGVNAPAAAGAVPPVGVATPPPAASEVVVTGTRIVSNGYTQPTPVTVAPATELLKTTPTDLADALNSSVPQFLNSSSPARATHNFTSSAENGNILNLRGVGGRETLILFDGQRLPPTTYLGEVDVDVIPNLLISRVDVVTGGASAVYGSDAVAGVVNFVLDRNFTGAKGEAQYGEAERGDNRNYRIGLAVGSKLFNDRGHVLLSAEDYNNSGMIRADRPISTENYFYGGSVVGSASAPGSAANPFTIYKNSSIAAASKTGLILKGPPSLVFQQFNASGTGTVPFNPGTATGTPGYFTNGDGLSLPADDTAIAPLNTKQFFGRFSYDITNNITGYVQGLFTRSELDYALEANGFVSPSAALFSGNPYLPASVQAAMTASGVNQLAVNTYPFGPNPDTSEVTDFWTVAAGLEGKFLNRYKWNLTYNHGHSADHVDQRDTLDWRKTFAALDAVTDPATGSIVCGPTLNSNPGIRAMYAGCQPLNLLNPSSTPGGLSYALGTSSYLAQVAQDDVAFSVAGPVFHLPAGDIQAAIGGEYRRESLDLTSNSNPALLETAAEQSAYFAGVRGVPAGTLAYWLTNTGIASASEDVKEGFGELDVPILRGLPGAESLDLNLAGRVTDYSTSGTVETWKYGGTWRPIQDILVRASESRDIRAPNLYELYAGDQSGIGQLIDPVTNTTNNVSTLTGGNSKLQPEIGNTIAAGVVISPRFLRGFSVSVDYYRLAIKGAISTLSAQQIVDDCAANASSPECQLITRPSPTSFPTLVRIAPANTSVLKTDGFDIDASYRHRLGPGALGARFYGNYLMDYVTQQDALEPSYQLAGTGDNGNQPLAYPHFRGTLNLDYSVGPFDAFVSEQYIGNLSLNSPEPNSVYEKSFVPPVWYTNLTVTYTLPMAHNAIQTYLTINNLFDKDFPLVPGPIPGVNLPTIISLYDTVGRAYTGGVRFRF